MKRNIKLSIIGWLLGCIGGLNLNAQTTENTKSDNTKKETQEIVIRKKGEKDTKLTLEITGDKVIINGKPIAEFNESGITINNRKILIREGNAIRLEVGGGSQNEMENSMNQFERGLGGMKPEDIESITVVDGKRMKGSSSTNKNPYVFLGVNTENNTEGAKILSIIAEAPAQKAGLLKGDIIFKIDDKSITGSADLSDVIKAMKINDKVKIYFKRDGKEKTVNALLAETNGVVGKTITIVSKDGSVKTLTIPRVPMPPAPPGFEQNWEKNFDGSIFDMRRPKLGLKIQDTEEGIGVKVLEVETGSASATAGLLKDDLITEIGNVKVQNTDDAREQLQENSDKSNYPIKAKRNGNEMTFNIKIPKKLKTANL